MLVGGGVAIRRDRPTHRWCLVVLAAVVVAVGDQLLAAR
ncbi:hypothetical protein JOF53_007292 [Crossiella equi]|uniref:Signal peptidase II n=1 Tax=Crossiella equi TaxID=130796 RepID=A0ABS5ARU7_9PSEU|nr:hypothetical protein [Crossiella equi]